jgi:hypothetical protein
VGVPELDQYCQQFEQVSAQARELTSGLSERQFNWRPAADEWSIEECLAHLIMVGEWELRAMEQAIDQARQRGITGEGPFFLGPLERFIVGQVEPPARNTLPAPRRFVPLHGQPITAIVPTFLHLQSQLIHLAERARGLDLARVKVKSPIAPLLRMSLAATFAQIAAHERRHIEQARRVRERLERSGGDLLQHALGLGGRA